MESQEEQIMSYCCRKCRTKLFEEGDIVPHNKGKGQESFDYHKRSVTTSEAPECNLYFVESSLKWIQENNDTSSIDGKLQCPKCGGKVGSWRWAGGQCSCGHWETPQFSVLKARVDPKNLPKSKQETNS